MRLSELQAEQLTHWERKVARLPRVTPKLIQRARILDNEEQKLRVQVNGLATHSSFTLQELREQWTDDELAEAGFGELLRNV